jgi:hypothetical protein
MSNDAQKQVYDNLLKRLIEKPVCDHYPVALLRLEPDHPERTLH